MISLGYNPRGGIAKSTYINILKFYVAKFLSSKILLNFFSFGDLLLYLLLSFVLFGSAGCVQC